MNAHELLTAMSGNKRTVATLEVQIDALNKEYDIYTRALSDIMKDQGIRSMKVEGVGSVSISEKTVPKIESWESFYEYIARSKAFHLLERRPSAKACVEAYKLEPLPGVSLTSFDTMRFTKAR